MNFSVPTNWKPFPIALVGAGAIVQTAHLPAALRSPLVDLVALVDKNTNNATQLANAYGLRCTIASDLSQVIDRVRGVVIATPPASHYPLAEFALSRGVHVLVEKPMTTQYSDAVKLCELAQRQGKVLAAGYYSRCHPGVILMKQMLDANYFGDILGFRLEHGSTGGWMPVSGYNLDRKQSGGGELMSNGTHLLDRLLYWFGFPNGFTYADDSYGGPEANCKAELRYDSELGRFRGNLFISGTIAIKTKFVLDTARYRCERFESQTRSLTLYPKENPSLRYEVFSEVESAGPEPDYFQEQLERFVGAVHGWCPIPVDGEFAAQSVNLIEQMYQHRTQLDEPWLMYRAAKEGTFVKD